MTCSNYPFVCLTKLQGAWQQGLGLFSSLLGSQHSDHYIEDAQWIHVDEMVNRGGTVMQRNCASNKE